MTTHNVHLCKKGKVGGSNVTFDVTCHFIGFPNSLANQRNNNRACFFDVTASLNIVVFIGLVDGKTKNPHAKQNKLDQ